MKRNSLHYKVYYRINRIFKKCDMSEFKSTILYGSLLVGSLLLIDKLHPEKATGTYPKIYEDTLKIDKIKHKADNLTKVILDDKTYRL